MLEQVSKLARQAGMAIMQIYQQSEPIQVQEKSDHSPVTEADLAAHQIIKQGLASIAPDIPQLSEEDPPEWEVRRHWDRYWLIDPLDGTKEFISKNGEFTVNIALIEKGIPVLGVVYAPVQNVLYAAANKKRGKRSVVSDYLSMQAEQTLL